MIKIVVPVNTLLQLFEHLAFLWPGLTSPGYELLYTSYSVLAHTLSTAEVNVLSV